LHSPSRTLSGRDSAVLPHPENRMSSPATADPPMIRMSGVDKYFGSLHVLRDINLDVARGEVVVVLGPSGSGKSTLCRTFNRLEPIDGGRIEVDGAPLPAEGRALARLRADVGMVFSSSTFLLTRPSRRTCSSLRCAYAGSVSGKPTKMRCGCWRECVAAFAGLRNR
jgi:ABC-type proline/glycine betaine transport system ATPase subunit